MAVTVEDSPSVVLDENDHIVGVNAAAVPWFEQHVGDVVFDVVPYAEALFGPYFDRARRSGQTVEFVQFHDGTLTRMRASPCGTALTVTWETMEVLDTFTLDGLRASLESMLAKLDAEHCALERDRVRDSLRLVVGGA